MHEKIRVILTLNEDKCFFLSKANSIIQICYTLSIQYAGNVSNIYI